MSRYTLRSIVAVVLASFALLGVTLPAEAVIAEAQAPCNAYAEGAVDPSCTLASNVTAGDLIVVVGVTGNNSPANLGDMTGAGGCAGTFTRQGVFYTDPLGAAFWTAVVSSNASCTVTWDKGPDASAGERATIVVYELSGWDGTAPIDSAAVFATGSGTSLTVSMNATAIANDYLIDVIATFDPTNVAYTAPVAGWTRTVSAPNTFLNVAVARLVTSSAGQYTAGWTSIANSRSRPLVLGAIGIKGVSTTPTILGTSPATSVRNGTALTINGARLQASGNSSVSFGGLVQPVTLQSPSAPTITVDRGFNEYGVPLPLILTDSNGAQSNTWTGTSIVPQAGWAFVNLTSLAPANSRITAVPDLGVGDQLAYDTKGGRVVVQDDATFAVDANVTSFSVEAWTSGSGWGAQATQTITVQP